MCLALKNVYCCVITFLLHVVLCSKCLIKLCNNEPVHGMEGSNENINDKFSLVFDALPIYAAYFTPGIVSQSGFMLG